MHNHIHWLALAVALCLPLATLAQSERSDPAAATASAPALRYQSAFSDYKPWQDIKPADWRAVNDKVRDAAASGGGHAGHNMMSVPSAQSTQSAPAASSAPPRPSARAGSAPVSKPSSPAMPGHGGHQMHGGKP